MPKIIDTNQLELIMSRVKEYIEDIAVSPSTPPDATSTIKGILTLGSSGGAARYGQKSDVGLGNVDNTSDANKPISTAVQTALNAKAASSTLTSHTSNGGIHITSAEKALLANIPSFDIGSYTGNGSLTQTISLGYQPRFVTIFPLGNEPLTGVTMASGYLRVYAAMATREGNSSGLMIETNGFTVVYNAINNGPDGQNLRTNESGKKYGYFVLK